MVLTLSILVILIGIMIWAWHKSHQIQVKRIRSLGDLKKISPLEFQYLTARIMRKKEWKNIRVNDKYKADGGWDVIGYKDKEKRLGQCKRYAFKATVGVEAVRELHGVCNSKEHGFGKGIFIATCKFSHPAKLFAKNNNILLWDLKAITDLL